MGLVIFDRDDTLAQDGEAHLLDGAGDAVEMVRSAGHKVAVLTNRPRTLSETQNDELNDWLANELDVPRSLVLAVDGAGRKPSPWGIEELMWRADVDLSWDVRVIGDKPTDAQAASAAGAFGCVIGSTDHLRYVGASSLRDAVAWAVSQRYPHVMSQADVRDMYSHSGFALVTGSFDLLHYGHGWMADQIEESVDGLPLIVAVNSDASYESYKGRSPVDSQLVRAVNVSRLAPVRGVTLFGEDDPRDLIRGLRPRVYFNSSEYGDTPVELDVVRDMGATYVPVPRLRGWSSTARKETA